MLEGGFRSLVLTAGSGRSVVPKLLVAHPSFLIVVPFCRALSCDYLTIRPGVLLWSDSVGRVLAPLCLERQAGRLSARLTHQSAQARASSSCATTECPAAGTRPRATRITSSTTPEGTHPLLCYCRQRSRWPLWLAPVPMLSKAFVALVVAEAAARQNCRRIAPLGVTPSGRVSLFAECSPGRSLSVRPNTSCWRSLV